MVLTSIYLRQTVRLAWINHWKVSTFNLLFKTDMTRIYELSSWLSKQPSIINTKSTKVFMLMFRLRGKQWSDPICVLASSYQNPGIKKIFIYYQVPSKSTHCHEDYVMMSTLNTVNLGSSCWYVLNWSVAKICDKETFI